MPPNKIDRTRRPALEALFAATHETVDISVGHGAKISFLDRIISDKELRVVPIHDRPSPLHAMANGKAILSGMSDVEIEQLMTGRMPALTHLIATSMRALISTIHGIRRSGYAYDRKEHALGVCAIGMPVRIDGMRPHAVSVVMPAFRFEQALPAVKKALKTCCASIEAIMAG